MSFEKGFQELTGHSPLSWQKRFYNRLMGGSDEIPSAIDLPTGLGKTSVMAIWYLAISNGAQLPRRLIYVVDRRVVVDQATVEANKIKENSRNEGLYVSTLRGQHTDNRKWLQDPTAKAIIVGTVDMIGSRLLFSGYGVSKRMRPFHAAFIGTDSLIVLDESHLVPSFHALLRTINENFDEFGPSKGSDYHIVPNFKLLSLSATGRGIDGSVFQLEDEDYEDAIIKMRLNGKKKLKIIECDKKALSQRLASSAWELSDNGKNAIRCIIYCNLRKNAEEVKNALSKISKKCQIELLVGGRRVFERKNAETKLMELGFLGGEVEKPKEPTFLIATSAGEVGIDLDTDNMVCDAVPFERIVQRLGRVNRRGIHDSEIILINPEKPFNSEDDSNSKATPFEKNVYNSVSILMSVPEIENKFDVSLNSLIQLKKMAEGNDKLEKKIMDATTPEPHRPRLVRPVLDSWAMTTLEYHTGKPDVKHWIRGWVEEEVPQTNVIWRKHLPIRVKNGEPTNREVEEYFRVTRPHLSEQLEEETYRVVDWLIERVERISKSSSPDMDNSIDQEIPTELKLNDDLAFLLTLDGKFVKKYKMRNLLRYSNKEQKKILLGEMSNKYLIVDARIGGLSEGLLDERNSETVRTGDDGGEWLSDDTGNPVIGFKIYQDAEKLSNSEKIVHQFATVLSNEGEPEKVLTIVSEHTEESMAVNYTQQLLEMHQEMVKNCVCDIGKNLGLEQKYINTLAIAAQLHDEGKRAVSWQSAFNAPKDGVYAKTLGPVNVKRLNGYRHEFGSYLTAKNGKVIESLDEDLKELALHLISSHHGNARPFVYADGNEDFPPSELEKLALEVGLRYARLQRRWGPWGLAWWEALLRTADQTASKLDTQRFETMER